MAFYFHMGNLSSETSDLDKSHNNFFFYYPNHSQFQDLSLISSVQTFLALRGDGVHILSLVNPLFSVSTTHLGPNYTHSLTVCRVVVSNTYNGPDSVYREQDTICTFRELTVEIMVVRMK